MQEQQSKQFSKILERIFHDLQNKQMGDVVFAYSFKDKRDICVLTVHARSDFVSSLITALNNQLKEGKTMEVN